MDNSEALLKVIDECVNKKINKSSIPNKIIGVVESVGNRSKNAKVNISGFDTSFTLVNKSGESLSVGDNVFIESIGSNLTNGFISEKFGLPEMPDWKDQSIDSYKGDPNTTLEPLLLTTTNTPDGSFYHIKTYFYSTRTIDANRSQIAIGYNVNKMYHRFYYSGNWSPWMAIVLDKNFYSGSADNINETCTLWVNEGTNFPTSYGFLLNQYINSDYISQLFFDANTNKVWTRRKIGGTWYSWTKFSREIEKYTYNSTGNEVSANSWQYMLTYAFTPNLEAGKYLIVLSFSVTGHANGMGTVRPLIDGSEISVSHRSSVPLASGLFSSGQVIFYYNFTSGIHNIIPQIYANVANQTSQVFLELYRIGDS